MEKDEAARARIIWSPGNHHERAAAESEWRANRQVESAKPEGDTFLPAG